MFQVEYLNDEEQFKEILNNKEIERIKDPELKRIREVYWVKRLEAFKDEVNIKDTELEQVFERIREQEAKELEAYKIRKGIKS